MIYSDELPRIVGKYPGKKAIQVIEECRRRESTGMRTFTRDPPLVWEETHGAIVKDIDGNSYLDLYGGYAVANIGYCNPSVVEAVRDQAGRMIHCPSAYPSRIRVELLKRLAMIAPGGLTRIMFSLTGAEANEVSLRLAKSISKKFEIIAFHGGYFGRTQGALGVAGKSAYRRNAFIPPAAHFLPYAYCYRCPFHCYPRCDLSCAEYVQHVLDNPASGIGDVAAMIIEPIQGNGGIVVPPPGYLNRIAEICKEHDILLIADEIQSGFGRSGKLWAIEHWGVKPDMVTVGKGLGGGLPFAAVFGREEIMTTWKPDSHTSTFLTNSLIHASAAAAVDVMLKERLWKRAAKLGSYALKYLKKNLSRHPRVGEVRGKGLFIGIELVKDKSSKTPDKALATRLVERALTKGLITSTSGYYGNVIKISPPLIITEKQLDFGMNTLVEILSKAD